MRRLALLVVLFSACHRGAGRIEGHWTGQKATGVATDAQAAANRFAAEMELDIHGGTIVVKTEHEKQTGHYRVVRSDKDTVVIVTDEDGPADEQTFTFDGDKSMKWSVVKDQAILFTKQDGK